MTDDPSRLVDANNQGWLHTGDGVYRADYGKSRGLAPMTLADLAQQRGPVRPVEPITDEDDGLLRETFRRCGRKAIATMAAALDVVFHEVRQSRGGLSNASESYDFAKRTLRAGREGSWESEVLHEIVLFGNGLNITTRGPVHTVEARRAAGPSKRVDRDGRDAIADVIRRWVTDPTRYTEVAETLAYVVSRYADETAGPDGWRAVADQWLQPSGRLLAHEDFSICYRLLYSQSEHFNPDLI
jgi:hypothetical protein